MPDAPDAWLNLYGMPVATCSICGTPTESLPCPDHQPDAYDTATAPITTPNGATPMPDLEHIAHTCHEANRALQVINGEDTVSPHWADAPEWQIESALDGVQRALDGETPEQLHRSWCAHKIRDGWVYAPEKNAEQKTHPCLVPYTELPPEQRLKDAVFHGIVRAFADSHQTGETQ